MIQRIRPSHLGWLAGTVLLLAVAVWAVEAYAPRGMSIGIVLVGLLVGSLNALVAVGLVLIYRAGRFINFAQGGIGAVGAVITAKLVMVVGLNFFIAVLAGIAAAVVLSMLAEILVIRRLSRAPRLILTVATIGLAAMFGAFEMGLNTVWKSDTGLAARLTVPFDLSVSVDGVVFGGAHLLVVVVVPLVVVGLIVFLRGTHFGTAVQASAENADRARLLGVSVRRVSLVVWAIAGLLAGVTAVLQAPIVGFTFGAAAGPELLLRALAPAMLAGLGSIGWAVVAALGLGVVEQVIVWNTGRSGPTEAALFVVVLVALFVRRRTVSRTTEAEESSFSAVARIRPLPRELAPVRAIRVARSGGFVLLLAAAVVTPIFLNFSQRNLAALLLIYALAALSLNMLSGYAGQVSFGHWAFVGLGALFGGWLGVEHQVNFVLGALIVCALGGVVAIVIGLPALRVRGLFLGVVTLAFAVSCSAFVFELPFFRVNGAVTRPALGPVDFDDDLPFVYLCLGILIAAVLAVRSFRTSRWGRNTVAVRDNDRAAASYGVSVVATKLLVFVASGAMAALAGYLYVYSQLFITPKVFTVQASLLLFAAVVIGGLGSVTGAVIGAFYLRGIEFFPPEVQLLSTSVGLLAILLLSPGGISDLIFRGRDALLRRFAANRGIDVPSLVTGPLDTGFPAASATTDRPPGPADRRDADEYEEVPR